MTLLGTEPSTFRLVAPCLNICTTAYPHIHTKQQVKLCTHGNVHFCVWTLHMRYLQQFKRKKQILYSYFIFDHVAQTNFNTYLVLSGMFVKVGNDWHLAHIDSSDLECYLLTSISKWTGAGCDLIAIWLGTWGETGDDMLLFYAYCQEV
jgi:hypothetical protein